MDSVSEQSILDERHIRELFGGEVDAVILEEIVTLFERESRRLIDNVESAKVAGDSQALEFTLHALVGCGLNMGAHALGTLARQYESSAKSGDYNVIKTDVLEELRFRTLKALKRLQ